MKEKEEPHQSNWQNTIGRIMRENVVRWEFGVGEERTVRGKNSQMMGNKALKKNIHI